MPAADGAHYTLALLRRKNFSIPYSCLCFTLNHSLHTWHARGILLSASEGRDLRRARRSHASFFCAESVCERLMRLKLYCNRYGHFKDALVCSVSCVYRTRCNDFALFYDERREETDALVADYYAARREQEGRLKKSPADAGRHTISLAYVAPVARPEDLRKLIRLEVLREMADSVYIWIDKEDHAELLETAEVIRRAARGQKAKHIYRVAQEMELRYQLVPRKRIEKARRIATAEAERAEGRRTRRTNARPTPVPFPAPVALDDAPAEAPAPRRARSRAGR